MIVFQGRTIDGKIHLIRKEAMVAEMRRHKHFDVIIRRHRKFRSSQQNRYYWGCILDIISQETGHTEDELHYAFRKKFLKAFDNKGLQFVQSTTELTTTEFMDYIEKVRRFAAGELGIVTPDPNEFE